MEWWSIKLQSVSHYLRDRRGGDRLVRHRNALLRDAKGASGLAQPEGREVLDVRPALLFHEDHAGRSRLRGEARHCRGDGCDRAGATRESGRVPEGRRRDLSSRLKRPDRHAKIVAVVRSFGNVRPTLTWPRRTESPSPPRRSGRGSCRVGAALKLAFLAKIIPPLLPPLMDSARNCFASAPRLRMAGASTLFWGLDLAPDQHTAGLRAARQVLVRFPRRGDRQCVALDLEDSHLLCAGPLFVPGNIDLHDPLIALDMVDTAVRNHRPEGRDTVLVGLGFPALLARD